MDGVCVAITEQYLNVLLEDAMKELASLFQLLTLKEYCKRIAALLNKVTICEEYDVSIFL